MTHIEVVRDAPRRRRDDRRRLLRESVELVDFDMGRLLCRWGSQAGTPVGTGERDRACDELGRVEGCKTLGNVCGCGGVGRMVKGGAGGDD